MRQKLSHIYEMRRIEARYIPTVDPSITVGPVRSGKPHCPTHFYMAKREKVFKSAGSERQAKADVSLEVDIALIWGRAFHERQSHMNDPYTCTTIDRDCFNGRFELV